MGPVIGLRGTKFDPRIMKMIVISHTIQQWYNIKSMQKMIFLDKSSTYDITLI
jgi:hypothetical protein